MEGQIRRPPSCACVYCLEEDNNQLTSPMLCLDPCCIRLCSSNGLVLQQLKGFYLNHKRRTFAKDIFNYGKSLVSNPIRLSICFILGLLDHISPPRQQRNLVQLCTSKSLTSSIPVLPCNIQFESEDILWTAQLCWGHCLKQDFQDISEVQNLRIMVFYSLDNIKTDATC